MLRQLAQILHRELGNQLTVAVVVVAMIYLQYTHTHTQTRGQLIYVYILGSCLAQKYAQHAVAGIPFDIRTKCALN